MAYDPKKAKEHDKQDLDELQYDTYEVVKGDTLNGIATKHKYPNWKTLAKFNPQINASNADSLNPGTVLHIKPYESVQELIEKAIANGSWKDYKEGNNTFSIGTVPTRDGREIQVSRDESESSPNDGDDGRFYSLSKQALLGDEARVEVGEVDHNRVNSTGKYEDPNGEYEKAVTNIKKQLNEADNTTNKVDTDILAGVMGRKY
jgi:LysM repeat protein